MLYRYTEVDFRAITLAQGVDIKSSTKTIPHVALASYAGSNRINPTHEIHVCGQSQFELIHDQLPLAVPCYDLFPVTDLTVVPPYGEPSGTTGSLELTGGEYKTRERIHRSLADLRLLAIPASKSRVADFYPN